LASEVSIAAFIVGSLLLPFVDFSIELYDESTITTAEVGDKGSNWMLAKELQAVESPSSKPLPKRTFSRGQVFPELSRLLSGRRHPSPPSVCL